MSKPLPKMNPVVKELWVDALCSGKYQQCQYQLKKDNEDYSDEECGYCCLGVLVDVKAKVTKKKVWGKEVFDKGANISDTKVQDWAGLDDVAMDKLIMYNDDKKWSFKKIASYIRRYL
jgi:hypothetical protein